MLPTPFPAERRPRALPSTTHRIVLVKWDRLTADSLFWHARAACPAADIVVCRSGREAESALHEQPADLGVFGLTFPDEDGLDLLPRILRERKAAKILVVSGRRDERTRESLRALRIDGYFDTEMEPAATLPEAIRAVLGNRPWFSAIPARRDAADSRPPFSQLLSPTELQVFAIAGEGCDDVRVAERLVISEHTARTHRQRVMHKLGVQTSRELIIAAIRCGVSRVQRDRILHPGLEEALAERAARTRTGNGERGTGNGERAKKNDARLTANPSRVNSDEYDF